MALFGRKKNKRAEIPVTPSVDDVLLSALLNNETITREKAMSLPAVAGAVDLIASTVASIPIKLYKDTNGRIDEVKDDPRVSLLNVDTKDTLDAYQFKKAIVSDYLMGKGGYCYIKKTRNRYNGLYYVPDYEVSIIKNNDPIYKNYEIVIGGNNYKPYEFIKILRNTTDGASGTGVTREVGNALETAYQTMIYQLNLVKSGGNKKGFLKSTRKLGQEEINVLKDAWARMYRDSTENVVVLNNGLEFQESANSSVEMQLNESKTALTKEINSIFHIEDDFNATFKKAIVPILTAFETALNRDFLLEREKKYLYWAFDTAEITKESIKDRYDAYKTAVETGFLTLNEIRYRENLNSIDGLDVVPLNLGYVLYDENKKQYIVPNTRQIKGETDTGNIEGVNIDENQSSE